MTTTETRWPRPLDEEDERERGVIVDDGIQHGIDDDANNDSVKGAALGGLGGMAVGAAAGAATGLVGAIVGAVVGGAVGAVASGAAVGAIDQVDNDDNITGLGDEADLKEPTVRDYTVPGGSPTITPRDTTPPGYGADAATLEDEDYESVWNGPAPPATAPEPRGTVIDAMTGDRLTPSATRKL